MEHRNTMSDAELDRYLRRALPSRPAPHDLQRRICTRIEELEQRRRERRAIRRLMQALLKTTLCIAALFTILIYSLERSGGEGARFILTIGSILLLVVETLCCTDDYKAVLRDL